MGKKYENKIRGTNYEKKVRGGGKYGEQITEKKIRGGNTGKKWDILYYYY